MSSTIHYALVRDPKLLDVVDEEWEKDKLPEDGGWFFSLGRLPALMRRVREALLYKPFIRLVQM